MQEYVEFPDESTGEPVVDFLEDLMRYRAILEKGRRFGAGLVRYRAMGYKEC